jgi:DMSO reductase family type II enzyme heme b subunit
MKVARVDGQQGFADPACAGWQAVDAEQVSLAPVALEAQPTDYIRETWKDRDYGQTARARLAAASDGDRLYLRVEWADDERPNGEFQDAVSAVFPTNGSGVLATLGDADKPLALWFWEHGRPAPLRLISSGPGVVRKDEDGQLGASGVLSDGSWTVVLSGPAAIAQKGKVALAVWNGSNEERAGLAAVSREWLPLELE